MNKLLFVEKLVISVFGIFLMALGTAFAIRSNLGIIPISCPPYVLSEYFQGLTVGLLLVAMDVIMVLAQVIILRKDFPLSQYSQILVGFLFGFFLDVSMIMVASIPSSSYFIEISYVLIGVILTAVGLIFEVTPKLLCLAGDGLMIAIARLLKKKLGIIKIYFDVILVAFSLITGWVLLKDAVGVREGTVISAILVGFTVTKLNPIISPIIIKFLEIHERKERQGEV